MKKALRPLLALVVVAAAAVGIWSWRGRARAPEELLLASGTVEATEARLGFQPGGRIAEILVREGDRVEAGHPLARLDRRELVARRDQAVAQEGAARAGLVELERGFRREEVAQARAARDAARERALDAERALDRTARLLAGGAVSQEASDKAGVALDLARSQLVQAEEQLRLLEAGPRRERVEAQRALVAQAEAAVRALDAQLAELTLEAPFPGVVSRRHREPGEVVPPGAPVLTLLDLEDRWVRIYIPEDRLGAVAIGDAARILSDTYPGRGHPGEVFYIASEAEFTPKTVQTREERVRLVYAVKVRVVDDPEHLLKPGMPVDVSIDLAGGSE